MDKKNIDRKNEEERVRQAKERAEYYKSKGQNSEQANESQAPDSTRHGSQVRSVSEWTDIIGQRIEEAVRRGAFDNLPGRGKPLDFSRDQFVPEDQRMAFKLLENNELAPAWIGERKDVLEAIAKLRRQIETAINQMVERSAQTGEAGSVVQTNEQTLMRQSWRRQVTQWDDAVRDLNKRILTLNLKQPATQLEVLMLRLDDELRKQNADRNVWSVG